MTACQYDAILFGIMTRYRERELAEPLERALKAMPVVVLTGMRQVGKSTMLVRHASFAARRYVTLDDLAELEGARRDPEAFVQSSVPMTIDEAQRAPELLLAVKREVDRKRRTGWYLLSGSANFALLRGTSESLAGRAVYMELHPFSRRETGKGRFGKPFIRQAFDDGEPPSKRGGKPFSLSDVMNGGMPPVVLARGRNRLIWLKGFIQTYVERDVRNLSQVGDLVAFQRLMRLASLRTGQVLEVGSLARDAQLSVPTVSRYLNILEASCVARTVRPFLSNRASRLVKSPKFYFTDSGVAWYLWGTGSPSVAAADPRTGALVETYAAENISSILSARWSEAELCFWGVQGRHEVDFVVEAGRDCLAIEVKMADRWRSRDLAGLSAFIEKTPNCRAGLLAYCGSETRKLGRRLWAVPLGELLS